MIPCAGEKAMWRWRLRAFGVLEDVLRSEDCGKGLHARQRDMRTSVARLRSLCPPGSVAVDVCFRSGSMAVATALVDEGRRFIGCESDARLVKTARYHVAQVLGGRRAGSDADLATV